MLISNPHGRTIVHAEAEAVHAGFLDDEQAGPLDDERLPRVEARGGGQAHGVERAVGGHSHGYRVAGAEHQAPPWLSGAAA